MGRFTLRTGVDARTLATIVALPRTTVTSNLVPKFTLALKSNASAFTVDASMMGASNVSLIERIQLSLTTVWTFRALVIVCPP